MIACPSCNTFNSDSERACLSCGAPLGATAGAEPERRTAAASPRGGGTRCPNGHPIDPDWSTCPYCANGGTGDRSTRLEGGSTRVEPAGGHPTRLEADSPPDAPPAPGQRTVLEGESAASPPVAEAPSEAGTRPTRLEEPAGDARAAHRTVLRPSSATPSSEAEAPAFPRERGGEEAPRQPPASRPSPAPGAPADTRPLVGVLAAPDAAPGGLIFPLRVGKNLIGGAPRCDVRLSHDPQISAEHALILHRGGKFYLNDRMATNGTFLNGEEIDPAANATPLGDRDRIRCGDTELILLTLGASTES